MSITFHEFKDKASELLNINLDGYKIKRVKRRTDSLMRRHDIEDYDSCLKLLKKNPDFKAKYMGHFTINTTKFFRNPDNFTYLQENVLPQLLAKNKQIKIWSAPCADGSEPYTIAIILQEMGVKKSRYKILASDLDSEILKIAQTGIYGNSSLKKVPKDILQKYFTKLPDNEKKFKVNNNIINKVEFEKKDLINNSYQKKWDLILSRNFFIYLTKELKKKLTTRFVDVLKTGGYLFLGNTEFIFNANQFGLKKEYQSFYQKID